MTTKKTFLKKALVVALSGALVAPAISSASPASAAAKGIQKLWSTTFLVGGTAPVQGLFVTGWKNDSVLVSVGAIATGSATANAHLRYNNRITGLEQFGLKWGYKSDTDTQTASNNGAGLDTLQFSGPQSIVNVVLGNLEVTTTAGTAGVEIKAMATDYKEGLIYFPKTEHFYKFVQPMRERVVVNGVSSSATMEVNTSFTWSQAKTAAEASTELGLTGYLATVASAEENDFVTSRISPDGVKAAKNVWIGGSTANTNYEWKWSGGPEKDIIFYKGCETSATTRTGSSPTGYHGFNGDEPNNWASVSDLCNSTTLTEGCLLTNNKRATKLGEWNDMPCNNGASEGYVIEYGNKTVGGDFVGIYTSSAKLIRPVPPTKPTLVETLARKIGSFKNAFAKFGKKSRGTSTVNVKILEKGTYRIYAYTWEVKAGSLKRVGLSIREGSKVNGVAIKNNRFTIRRNSKTTTITLNINSGKTGVRQPTVTLIRDVKNRDGSITSTRQDIPSNWKIALR